MIFSLNAPLLIRRFGAKTIRGGHCVKKKAKKNEIRAAERQEEKN